ncbi:MAG TPA: IS30 family transposase [Clostridiaceae bacterium]|nr:IS30 family transposase [Clostridiaceae bacterium]
MGHLHHINNERRNKHFTYKERLRIEVMHKEKLGTLEISKAIGCSQRSVQRELKRGKVTQLDSGTWIYYETYSADLSQNRYEQENQSKGPALKIGHDIKLCEYIEKQIIDNKQSPDAVIGRIKATGMVFETTLSTKTLYRYIDQGIFGQLGNQHLIYGKRKRSTGKATARPSYKNIRGRGIEERSEEINERSEIGHWEMDCVVGGKGTSRSVLLTLTERQTRMERIIKLSQKTQEAVVTALDVIERQMGRKRFAQTFKSITVDNGCEFLNYAGIERSIQSKKKTRTIVYYAHPYSSWERGTNENMNRMIRRFIPKGADISKFGKQEIKRIQEWLNTYPRKILNYRTPAEVYNLVA